MIGNWILTTMLLPTSQNVDFQKQVSEIRVMQKQNNYLRWECWPIKMAVWREVQDRVYPLSTFALYNKKATSLLYQIKNVQ